MSVTGRERAVRSRMRALLANLRPEDLEERVAPVKCEKHPDSPECGMDYGVPLYDAPAYGVPDYGAPEGGGGS